MVLIQALRIVNTIRFCGNIETAFEMLLLKFESKYDKTNKMTRAPGEYSDQPGHPPRLIRVFACAQWVAKVPMFLHADSEDSDQIGRIPRLI